MVRWEMDGTDFNENEFVTVEILAIHSCRGLAFVRMQDGTIRTAKCDKTYHKFDKADMFKDTGVIF